MNVYEWLVKLHVMYANTTYYAAYTTQHSYIHTHIL